MTTLFLFLAGLFAGISTNGGNLIYLLPVALVSAVFWWINRSKSEPQPPPKTGTLKSLQVTLDETSPVIAPSFIDPQEWNEKSVTDKRIKQSWVDLETELDMNLYSAMQMLRAIIPHVHSALLFYPGETSATSLRLHRFASLAPNSIIDNVEINEGQGLLGLLLKGELRQILEGDIAQARLFYYSDQTPINSIAAVPMMLHGEMNGAIVIDSLEPNAFTEETISHLITYAKIICGLIFQTSTNLIHQREREQYKELFEYQKRFMDNMSMDDILRSIAAFVAKNIPYDRIMILHADEEAPSSLAKVVFVTGVGAEGFEELEMPLDEKGLLSLCFSNRRELHRQFAEGEEVYRVSDGEPTDIPFRSLIASPIYEDEHSPVRMVVCVESLKLSHYPEFSRNLLRNICNSAGFAYTRVKAYQEKQKQASRDALTGLFNRHAFPDRLHAEVLRAKRQNSMIGLMMADIDKFKAVNDTYGHPIGDLVLEMVAKQIVSAIREEVDFAARLGGEEFVVVITGASDEVVKETGERIRKSIEQTGVDVGLASPLYVTISIGYALYPLHSDDPKAVLDKADIALYSAKENGRNRVVGFH